MTTKFIDAIEAGDAVAFQDHFNSRMSDKTTEVLDALKIEVAKKFFNTQPEAEAEVEGEEEVVEEGKENLQNMKLEKGESITTHRAPGKVYTFKAKKTSPARKK